MLFTSDAQIHAIFSGLVDRTLPKSEWTHAAHFAAAFAILTDSDYDAAADMPGIIQAYNEATGVQNTDSEGYHHTITLASLRAARHVYETNDVGTPLYKLTNELLASQYGRSDWLLTYWSQPVLFSVKARRNWVSPDLRNLPF